MKRHPAWSATGLLIFALLACNLSKNSNNSNNSNKNSNDNKNTNTNKQSARTNPDIYITRIFMAKDDNGKPGDETSSFQAAEHTVHCIANLNKAKKGTKVRFTWKMIDVAGSKDKEIRTSDYTTNSFEKKVHGYLTLPSDWPKGTYGVEVYIDGELDKSIEYTVE
jgi:hypothetical protein